MLCAIRFHHANISLGIVPAQNFSFLPISLGDDFPIEHPEAHWKRGVDRQTHHFWVNFPIDNHINPMISIMTATLSPRCYYQKVAFPMGYTLKVAIDYPHFITFPSFWLSWHFPWINMWASWLRDLSPQRGRHGPELLGVTGRGWCLRCGGLRLPRASLKRSVEPRNLGRHVYEMSVSFLPTSYLYNPLIYTQLSGNLLRSYWKSPWLKSLLS